MEEGRWCVGYEIYIQSEGIHRGRDLSFPSRLVRSVEELCLFSKKKNSQNVSFSMGPNRDSPPPLLCAVISFPPHVVILRF